MRSAPGYSVESIKGLPVHDLLQVLGLAYDEEFSEERFAWKHREGPWGPSRGWAAVDDRGVAGVVFCLPWHYRTAGRTVPAGRLVDGGTAPRALRRGIFRALVARELEEWGPDRTRGVLIATATPEAQQSHVKLGATALPPISFAYGLSLRPRRARLTTGAEVLDTFVESDRSHLVTPWDTASLCWRTDPRSGYSYEAASLASAESPNGVAFRILSVRGLRLLLPLVAWGSLGDQRVLLSAVARTHFALGVLAPHGDGAAAPPRRPVVRRGQSLLCVWDRMESESRPSPLVRSSWALSAADLEGVI